MVEGNLNGKPLRSSRLKCRMGSEGLGIPPCIKNWKNIEMFNILGLKNIGKSYGLPNIVILVDKQWQGQYSRQSQQ